MDTRRLTITRRMRLTHLETESRIAGLLLSGTQAVAVSPDGNQLLLAAAEREGVRGLALLNAQSGTPLDFAGPLAVSPYGITTLPPSPSFPSGAFAVVATRTVIGPDTEWRPDTGWLFLLDAATLAARDSVALGSTTSAPSGGLGQILASPDGQRVYMATSDQLISYDVTRQQIVASTPRPSQGRLAISPDGTGLYLTDPGDGRDNPGSGHIYVFGPLLEPRSPIELPRLDNGLEQTTQWAALGRNGRTLYVSTGTPEVGPLFPGGPGQIFVIDVGSRRIVENIRVGEWGLGPLFVR